MSPRQRNGWQPTEKQRFYLLRGLKVDRVEIYGRGSNWTIKPLLDRGLVTKGWTLVGPAHAVWWVRLTDAGRELAESLK